MSQEKAQLIAPIGIMTVSGMTATGVITASSFTGNIVGSAKSLVNGTDVTAGVVTATSFVGNLTGNIQRLADSAPNINVGVTTATSFVGNLTGSVTDLTSAPAITVGLVTATSLEGPITGNVTGNVVGNVGGNVVGNITGNVSGIAELGLGINYNGGWTGAGTSQINAGVVTATTFYGDGSNLDGVSSGPVSQQSIGITSASTTIDLSNGNLIYATQSADTTVSFANTANGNVYIIRKDDDSGTDRSITWPTGIGWSGGSAPTLVNNTRTTDAQVFLLVTRNMGETWYGKEVVRVDPQTYALWGAGRNLYGTLGNNTKGTSYSSPVQIGAVWKNVADAASATYSRLAVRADGTLWSWGYNAGGQLGQNNVGKFSSPTQVGTDTDWSQARSISNHAVASKTDGTIWMWGTNTYGQLGHNNRTSYSSPVQLSGEWSWATGGAQNSIGTKTDGTLWCWGRADRGAVGNNNTTHRSSPVSLGSGWDYGEAKSKNFNDISVAFKSNGELWAWGKNQSRGLLGISDTGTSYFSSPKQVPGTTWSEIGNGGSGFNGYCASKTNGRLAISGTNSEGQYGNNSNNSGSPGAMVEVCNGKTFDPKVTDGQPNFACGGGYRMIAADSNGQIWFWGANNYGGAGLNDDNNGYSSPVQIPGKTGFDQFSFSNDGTWLGRVAG